MFYAILVSRGKRNMRIALVLSTLTFLTVGGIYLYQGKVTSSILPLIMGVAMILRLRWRR